MHWLGKQAALSGEEFKIHFRPRKIRWSWSEDNYECPDESFRKLIVYDIQNDT